MNKKQINNNSNKNEEKPGDLNRPISAFSKTSFFGEGFKNDSTTDREIDNEMRYLEET